MMRNIKSLVQGTSKWIAIAVGILVLSIIVMYFYSSDDVEYSIESKNVDEYIIYPNVNYAKSEDYAKMNHINNLIAENLYGPYDFSQSEDVSVSLNYEIIFMNEKYLSICYKGTYTVRNEYHNNFCYGVNIDLEKECIIPIQEVLGDGGIEKLHMKIKNKDFKTEFGAITPEETYIAIDDILPHQSMFKEDLDYYHYFFKEDSLFIIITGLPLYGGNYSILRISDPENDV